MFIVNNILLVNITAYMGSDRILIPFGYGCNTRFFGLLLVALFILVHFKFYEIKQHFSLLSTFVSLFLN